MYWKQKKYYKIFQLHSLPKAKSWGNVKKFFKKRSLKLHFNSRTSFEHCGSDPSPPLSWGNFKNFTNRLRSSHRNVDSVRVWPIFPNYHIVPIPKTLWRFKFAYVTWPRYMYVCGLANGCCSGTHFLLVCGTFIISSIMRRCTEFARWFYWGKYVCNVWVI